MLGRILGTSDLDPSGSKDEGVAGSGLGYLPGSKGSATLNRLHHSQRQHPGEFARCMEVMAADTLAVPQGSSDIALQYVKGRCPSGSNASWGT